MAPKKPRPKKRGTVVQRGKTITVTAEGYEFRAEDIGWLNIHRGVLDRQEKRIVLTFPNVDVAMAAFDEMLTIGAGNVDSVPDLLFSNDDLASLADRLGDAG
jgi:hypothetical protein